MKDISSIFMQEELPRDGASYAAAPLSVSYCVMDPTGNRTILVETPVQPSVQPYVGARLMECVPGAEQVGFLSDEEDCAVALRMAGGEFCGNASMSAAVYVVMNGRTAGNDVILHVSGAAGPVRAVIEAAGDGTWNGTVNMPRPLKIERVDLPGAGVHPVVRFDGIAHIILEDLIHRAKAETYVREWCLYLGADAAGLMFLDREKWTLDPLVYVPAADTLFWENSCASGSSAVGAFLADECGGPVTVTLRQPGGNLTVEADGEGSLRLSGNVRFLGRGSADLAVKQEQETDREI